MAANKMRPIRTKCDIYTSATNVAVSGTVHIDVGQDGLRVVRDTVVDVQMPARWFTSIGRSSAIDCGERSRVNETDCEVVMSSEIANGPIERTAGIPVHTILRVSAWLGVAVVVGMTAIFFVTGIGQDPLQYVHPVDEYAGFLLRNPVALRATI